MDEEIKPIAGGARFALWQRGLQDLTQKAEHAAATLRKAVKNVDEKRGFLERMSTMMADLSELFEQYKVEDDPSLDDIKQLKISVNAEWLGAVRRFNQASEQRRAWETVYWKVLEDLEKHQAARPTT